MRNPKRVTLSLPKRGILAPRHKSGTQAHRVPQARLDPQGPQGPQAPSPAFNLVINPVISPVSSRGFSLVSRRVTRSRSKGTRTRHSPGTPRQWCSSLFRKVLQVVG